MLQAAAGTEDGALSRPQDPRVKTEGEPVHGVTPALSAGATNGATQDLRSSHIVETITW